MLHRIVTRQWVLPSVLFLILAGVLSCSELLENPAGPTTTIGSGNSGGPSGSGGSGGSGGSAGPPAMGTLLVKLTDSPFGEAQALLVNFSEVSVHRSEREWETLPFAGGSTERSCDLKRLQGPVDVLAVGSLAAGHYTQIRLTVVSATIFFDAPSGGNPCAAQIAPPGEESAPVEVPSGVVKLNREFTVTGGGTTTLLLDFDGDRSIKQTGTGNGTGNAGNGNGRGNPGNGRQSAARYIMSPVIAVVSVE